MYEISISINEGQNILIICFNNYTRNALLKKLYSKCLCVFVIIMNSTFSYIEEYIVIIIIFKLGQVFPPK